MPVVQKPILHGRDHGCGGADPIPGICLLNGPDETLSELILATPGLVAFWKLNESSGNIAYDSFDGWDMDEGAYAPPTWGQPAGPPGEQSARFGPGLGLSHDTFPALDDELTLELWAYRTTPADDPSHDTQWLIGQGDAQTANHAGINLLIENSITGAHDRLLLYVGDFSGGPHLLESDTPLALGTWYHCAVTRSGHVWTLYLNGVAQTSSYDDSGTNYDAASDIWVGTEPVHPPHDCRGSLSYVAAYDRALSAGEIGAHYLVGTSGSTGGSQVLVSSGGGDPHWGQVAGDAIEDEAIANRHVATAAAIAPTKLDHPGGTTDFLRADGTWAAPAAGAVATDTIFDAKGDLPAGTGVDTAARLAAGTNGQLLSADSSTATGLKWITAPSGGDPALDTKVWMPLFDSDGSVVFDDTDELIPTLIPLA